MTKKRTYPKHESIDFRLENKKQHGFMYSDTREQQLFRG